MPRFTFKKAERLCSRKAIEDLYTNGRSFYVSNLKLIYKLQQEITNQPCRVVFSAPKKSFKRAVDRNLIKRRLREAYRLNKYVLYDRMSGKKIAIDLLVLYTAKEVLSFDEIQNNVKQGIKTLIDKTGTAPL